MTAPPSIDLSGWLTEQLGQASPDLLRQMITTFVQALMGAEADAVCGAEYGVRSEERTNTRNGYRRRDWDTRAGTIELAIPKLRSGSYFPDWLLERRRRAEAALVSVVAHQLSARGLDAADGEAGRRRWASTGCPSRRSSAMAKDLDEQVEAFRTRPLDAGPVYVRRGRRAGAQSPRGRAHGQRPRAARDRGQCRGIQGDPRPARHLAPRTAPAGWRSSATWSPAACPGSRWSPATRTAAWSRPSAPPCPARAGSAAEPTTRPT